MERARTHKYRYPLAEVNFDSLEIKAVTKTLKQGRTTCGKNVATFERTFSEYVGSRHAAMVNSGSSADLLVAFGLGAPDHRTEILLPAVTWPTQVWSCLIAGYNVCLVDVDPDTLQMNTDDLARQINTDTRAVFLTHLLGNVGNIEDIKAIIAPFEGVDIVEDCCESLGARWKGQHVGTFGSASAFSFFFSHLINTMEGGMVVTNDPLADKRYRLLRSHGWEPQPDCRFWFPTWGFNLRPTEVQGAFGCVQMTKIDNFLTARNMNAFNLKTLLSASHGDKLAFCKVLDGCVPAWHGFPILVKSDEPGAKDNLCSFLEQHGIETRPIVAGNLSRQQAVTTMTSGRVRFGNLPGADIIHERGLYIGISSRYDTEAVSYVSDVFDMYYR
jgi:CDP-6-deoxy-D-xylo-4-hexulose-3-dehydrase